MDDRLYRKVKKLSRKVTKKITKLSSSVDRMIGNLEPDIPAKYVRKKGEKMASIDKPTKTDITMLEVVSG